jgi:tRNA(fMet)-specific endonuclease VapC
MNPMLVLDTDHLSEFERASANTMALRSRLVASGSDVVATIVPAEEQLRGWLARIHSTNSVHNQLAAYAKLQDRLSFYAKWRLLPWTAGAADRFLAFRKAGVRIGTMDLKIASIALEHEGTVLSQNLVDFEKVPGLRVESWL